MPFFYRAISYKVSKGCRIVSNPIISIIVPVYGVEKYLDECIVSILRQSFTDFELILVDDCSKDRSGEICDKYAKEDKRVRVHHNKDNKGVASSRNIGIDMATGEYICFVDSDDYIFEDYLKTLYDEIIKYKTDIVACNHINFEDGTVIDERHYFDKNAEYTVDRYRNDIERVILDIEHTERYVCIWNKIYKASVWKDIRFPDGKFSEDTYIFYKLLDSVSEFIYIDAVLYARRLNEGSETHHAYSIRNWNFVEAKCEQFEYFQNRKMQRCMEASYDSVMHYYWWNINEMKKNGIVDDSYAYDYLKKIRKYVKYLRVTKTYPLGKLLKQYYIAYLKKI